MSPAIRCATFSPSSPTRIWPSTSTGWRRITTTPRAAASGFPCIAGCCRSAARKSSSIAAAATTRSSRAGRSGTCSTSIIWSGWPPPARGREEIDLVMCTHLHHDHVGWNTQQRDGKWVPTFPNARYVFSKPDVDYFSKVDADPKEGPAELGTFRECVVPILEYGKADLVSGGPYRLNDFIEIDSAPGHSPGHVFFKLESKGAARRLHRRRLAPSAAGLLSRLEFPEKLRCGAGARQPAQGARLLRGERRAGDARPRRLAVRRPHRKDRGRLPAGFQA